MERQKWPYLDYGMSVLVMDGSQQIQISSSWTNVALRRSFGTDSMTDLNS